MLASPPDELGRLRDLFALRLCWTSLGISKATIGTEGALPSLISEVGCSFPVLPSLGFQLVSLTLWAFLLLSVRSAFHISAGTTPSFSFHTCGLHKFCTPLLYSSFPSAVSFLVPHFSKILLNLLALGLSTEWNLGSDQFKTHTDTHTHTHNYHETFWLHLFVIV